MKLTPLQKRAARHARNQQQLDLNLVSLIDVFTLLIFFLLSNSGGIELLQTTTAVKLPESTALKEPKETLVVAVSGSDIVVEGRRIAAVAEVLADAGDLSAPLKAELDRLSTRQVVRAENQATAQAITILGDKDIPYQLLRKVMFSAARAGYADVRFAVRQKVVS